MKRFHVLITGTDYQVVHREFIVQLPDDADPNDMSASDLNDIVEQDPDPQEWEEYWVGGWMQADAVEAEHVEKLVPLSEEEAAALDLPVYSFEVEEDEEEGD